MQSALSSSLRAPVLPQRPLLRRTLTRSVPVVRCQAQQDRNAPEQANKTGALSSMNATVAPLPRSEEARKYFRTVYDFPQWQKHRGQYRFINRLFQISQSHILQNVVPAISWVMLVSAAVATYMTAYDSGTLPAGLPSLSPNASCQAFISNTSVALSLLLVFRTNSSYGRWDEARKMWGGLLNRSRDIMRQGATCFPDDAVESKKALARWVVAFARALRIHFQPEVTIESELQSILNPAELKALASAQHRPVRAIHAISQIIQSVPMSSIHQMQMSQNLTFFHDVLGGCERLLRAPIPVSYTRHTARFLFAWLTLLPFALYGQCGWGVVPVCGGIAAVLCGIEEIGVQCEEPFGILPLDVICNRIQADVMATLKDDEDTKAILAEIWKSDLANSATLAPLTAAARDEDAAFAPVTAGAIAAATGNVAVAAAAPAATTAATNGNGNGAAGPAAAPAATPAAAPAAAPEPVTVGASRSSGLGIKISIDPKKN